MLNFAPAKELTLRPYQLDSVDGLRQGVRDGRKRQILVAPTGAGKTIIASHLLREADRKGSYSLFLVDRVALVDQTSKTLDDYGIRHGVVQGGHSRWAPHENVQVCSIQTLARRHLPRHPSLIVYDEAHCIYQSATDFMAKYPDAVCVGLTATPFTAGLGEYWSGVVNVTTTRTLIDGGFLIQPKIYVARSPEDAELGLNSFGEFSDRSAEAAGIRIVGDVVSEWIAKTQEHFGGPVKTIVFSPSVDHGREICAAFAVAGFNFQQLSYMDRDDEERRVKIGEFRRPDSMIHGLVSCGVLTKGFDVADVKCGISCKPYRKSLSSHLQEIGRIMRPMQGEDKTAIWLDHSGNIERFAVDMFDVWDNGAGDLQSGQKRDAEPRKRDETTREKAACQQCSGAMRGNVCLCCGWERPSRSGIVTVDGVMQEFSAEAMGLTARVGLRAECLKNPKAVYNAALCYAIEHSREGDGAKARKQAYAVWRGIYPDDKPPFGWFDMKLVPPDVNAFALIGREVQRFRKYKRKKAA